MRLNLDLLERLTNAFGPSGHEREVQKLVLKSGEPFGDKTLFDKSGSVIFQHGTSGPKIMIAGHVDEIGYMINSIEPNGYLKVSNLGGFSTITLIGQEILIRPFKGGEKILGITTLGNLTGENCDKIPPLNKIYVDIGCSSAEEVHKLGIRLGDPAVPFALFRTVFRQRNEKIYRQNEEASFHPEFDHPEIQYREKIIKLAVAKAFDDRIGVFMALEVLRRLSEGSIDHPNQVFFASTTQEEVGGRGGRTAAHLIQPDIGFSLDTTVCGCVPGCDGIKQKMGGGITISAYDSSMIANPLFRKFTIEVAEEKGIKFQTGFTNCGGTDGGQIHITGVGAPSLFLGIPTRYAHSHHSMLNLDDVEHGIQLLLELIQELDEKKVASFTQLT